MPKFCPLKSFFHGAVSAIIVIERERPEKPRRGVALILPLVLAVGSLQIVFSLLLVMSLSLIGCGNPQAIEGQAYESGEISADEIPMSEGIVDGKLSPFYGSRVAALLMGETGRCSATVIHNHLLLTAAHCLLNRTTQDIRVMRTTNPVEGDFALDDVGGIVDFVVHPEYKSHDMQDGYDLAILKTDFDLLDVGFTIVDLSKNTISSKLRKFANYELVGAGSLGAVPSYDLSQGQVTGGLFQGGMEAYRQSQWRSFKSYFADQDVQVGDFVVLRRSDEDKIASVGACEGDSGGAFWERTSENSVELVGVIVRSHMLKFRGVRICGSGIDFIPVQVHAEWIKQTSDQLLEPTPVFSRLERF